MLAGLVHDIGALLPLYLYADRRHSRLAQTTLEELVCKFSATIGTKLLQSWNFPDELVDVAAGHENLQRMNNSNVADYIDVVTMANLQMPGTAKFVVWKNVFAAERLGYYAADCQDFLSKETRINSFSSFPRRREPSQIKYLDPRFRGDGELIGVSLTMQSSLLRPKICWGLTRLGIRGRGSPYGYGFVAWQMLFRI